MDSNEKIQSPTGVRAEASELQAAFVPIAMSNLAAVSNRSNTPLVLLALLLLALLCACLLFLLLPLLPSILA